ncbi:MAG: hypothetical protein K6G91_02170 [Kiritimatiellae bacterium]|nr:hypothetical protein [Kiritimatiellia bacterium]
MDNTTSTEPQTAAENIPATNATPTAEPPAAEIADAPKPTTENRDFTAAVNLEHAEPFRRTTRQFDLGDNRRLVDMRPSNGGLKGDRIVGIYTDSVATLQAQRGNAESGHQTRAKHSATKGGDR